MLLRSTKPLNREFFMNHASDITSSASATANAPERTRNEPCYRPAVDIVERDQELVILTDMPGVCAESIEIDFEDGELTIHGRVPKRQTGETKYLSEEYGIGDFQRVFEIGESIDATRISADYADGVLTIRLPKVELCKPRKIAVQAK